MPAAMLVQSLSGKVGLATGRNLPELCREHFRRRTSLGLWVQAEIIAMATDLAEFVGAAIALNLLFGIPLFPAGLITAAVAFGLLGLQGRGYRHFEVVIAGMLGVILLGFLYDTLRIGADASAVAGGFVPSFSGTESVLLATGILGATVMPHVIYLVTMTPALVVLAIGIDPTRALVISQVVLSFGIPFALVPLIVLTRRHEVMGPLVNRAVTTAVATVVAGLIIALNAFLLVDTFFG